MDFGLMNNDSDGRDGLVNVEEVDEPVEGVR